MRKKREAADSENQVSPQIDTLLLIDRNVDLLTPMFTQLTYEGLIDELYGIHHSKSCRHRIPKTDPVTFKTLPDQNVSSSSVAFTVGSVDEIPNCDYSNESY